MSRHRKIRRIEALIWIVAFVAMLATAPFPRQGARAADGSKLVFAFQEASVSQTVSVANIGNYSTIEATVSAAEVQDWKVSDDRLLVGIAAYGAGGGLIYQHSTGWVDLASATFANYSISISAAGVGAGWDSIETVTILIAGQDGESWAGNYGTAVESASLKADGTELLSNTEFTSNSWWTSSIGWQQCSGNAGGLPCIGTSAVEINAPTTTVAATTTEATTTTTTTIPAGPTPFPNAGFEDNAFTGWNKGSQTGTLGGSITAGGTGVSIFTGSRTFSHGPRSAVGSPTLSNGSPNPYYAPAVAAGSWTFSPNNATYAAFLQPKGEQNFAQAMTALGLAGSSETALRSTLSTQAQASGFGSGNPTDAAWITREVQMTAGVTYTMNWNYVGTDYVPFNDGSVTSLVAISTPSSPTITVNNSVGTYALLGFTNPGTGDYSTNSFGATGWQMSTYQVSVTGTYKLGFAVFNLDDTSLSPALMIDNSTGETQRCVPAGSNCTSFGGVVSNNPTAPTVVPVTTTTPPATTTTVPPATTTTVPAPTSLQVTSLLDDGSSGTLRWAITQANAQTGGMYDSITITQQGTITLTSDLPAITEGVSITGTGRDTTIIDGNNLYRQIYSSGSRVVTIQNLTLKQGKNVSWNGGTIYNSQGTFTVTNVHITQSSGWAFYQHGGGVTTFNNCLFTQNGAGVTSDHGSTPSSKSLTDTDYTNRIYVTNSQFTNNVYGIFVERFIRINGSTFADNSMGAFIRGLNRQQVYNSQFTNNGVGVAFSSWIPTSWTPGTDNQLVEGSAFDGNGTAIQFNNYFNNGSTSFNGNSSNSWSTSRNNTFGALTENTNNYQGLGFVVTNDTVVTTTTTTTTPPIFVPEETLSPAPEPLEPLQPTPEPDTDASEEEEPTPTIVDDSEEDEPVTVTTAPEEEPVVVEPEEPVTTTVPSTVEELEEALTEADDEEKAEVVAAIVANIEDLVSDGELSDEEKDVIVAAVTSIIESGLNEEVATELATSAAVLESVTTDQAEQIFEAVDESALSPEQANAIVEAVQEAPSEVREAFEAVVAVFGGMFDSYTMLNQNINVGQRRTVIAANLLISAAAASTLVGASGPAKTPAPTTHRQEMAARREDEEEASGEISGDGVEWIRQIRIFKYVDGVRVMDWSAFFKKFAYGIMNMGFTLAGSLVVYLTLSGPIQKIAGISTVLAIAAAMWLHMKEPDES